MYRVHIPVVCRVSVLCAGPHHPCCVFNPAYHYLFLSKITEVYDDATLIENQYQGIRQGLVRKSTSENEENRTDRWMRSFLFLRTIAVIHESADWLIG